MRYRFEYLIALEYTFLAMLLIWMVLWLHPFKGSGRTAAPVPMKASSAPGHPELTHANAVFLPFDESPTEVVSRPLVPGGERLELRMLKGWFGGRLDRLLNAEGEWEFGEIYEFLIEEDGEWVCAAVGGGHFLRYRYARGHVNLVNGRVLFEADGIAGNPAQRVGVALPVWWGERLYLLGPGDVARFCDSINWGDEPRHAIWGSMAGTYVRARQTPICEEGSVDAPVGPGLPLLPNPAAGWILRAPLEGRLTEPRPDGSWRADVGSLKGVFRGMSLRGKVGGEVLRVEQVEAESCVVRAIMRTWPPLSPGMLVWSDARAADRTK